VGCFAQYANVSVQKFVGLCYSLVIDVCVDCPKRLNGCLLSLKCRTDNVYISLIVADFSWTNPFHLVNFPR
jgi:hypothetical protein